MNIVHHGWNNDCTVWQEGIDFRHAILGQCHGYAIKDRHRGGGDHHVVLVHLVEDDEVWHAGQTSGITSSYWLGDMVDVLARARKWVEENCDPDPSGYGYIFRN